MVWQSQTLLPDRNDDGVDRAKPCCLAGMMAMSTKPKLTAWTGLMIVWTKPKLTAWTGLMIVWTKPKLTAWTGMVMVLTKPNQPRQE